MAHACEMVDGKKVGHERFLPVVPVHTKMIETLGWASMRGQCNVFLYLFVAERNFTF